MQYVKWPVKRIAIVQRKASHLRGFYDHQMCWKIDAHGQSTSAQQQFDLSIAEHILNQISIALY